MTLLKFLIKEMKEWPVRAEFVSDNRLSIAAFGMDGYCEALDLPSGKLIKRGGMVTKREWQAAVDALNAPKVEDIKWPDGAEFVGTGDSEGFDPFYRNITDDSYEVLCSDSLWRKLGGTPAFTPLTPRPAKTELDKSAQKVVEPEIDWSNQPEGFPLWLEGTTAEHRNHNGWYRDSGQIFEGADGGQWRSVREGQFFTVHRKPEPKVFEWDGKGNPPAGSTCQIRHSGWAVGSWDTVDIKYISSEYLIIGHGEFKREQHFHMPDIQFRPIRTAEQLAAEERENAIDEMSGWAGKTEINPATERLILERLYDAGFRKQVAK